MTDFHVPAGEGAHHVMIDGDHVVKTAVHDAAGAFEVFEVVAPPAPMAPPHVSPAGTPSTFEVVGDPARIVVITSGDGAGRFFEDFAHSVSLDQPIEESMEAILSVTQRHGVSLTGA